MIPDSIKREKEKISEIQFRRESKASMNATFSLPCIPLRAEMV